MRPGAPGTAEAPEPLTSGCRSCGAPLGRPVLDLGEQPNANRYVSAHDLPLPEPRFPLRVSLCESCWLLQLADSMPPEALFQEYAYFSSYSQSWLRHAESYAEEMLARLELGPGSLVVEVASNDGYLLRNFVEAGVPVLGIEPARNVAAYARSIGVPTREVFLGRRTAAALRAEGVRADLLVGNNVLAHVPDLNDFVAGLGLLLAPNGLLTMEFPHVLHLVEESQFDTIYHEHYSYLSLTAVQAAFARHGLALEDVQEVPTHGGSLRICVRHGGRGRAPVSVTALQRREVDAGLTDPTTYDRLRTDADRVRRELVGFLRSATGEGRRVAGYGAPAKGNTLLNFCGVGTELLPYTVDLSPHKQGRYLPGSHVPIRAPEELLDDRPDYVLILPWNLEEEIVDQMRAIRSWGGRFVVAIPELRVF
ncbi:MAG TPA: class I SAM-dependent methyltransferase [Gaiellaceae bacterium]|nr:class I SAM-dependent methyltransferase [Gaiellaceae bacterium]